ncbi:MAG: hypothetical protein ACLP01_13260 [Solirubrobacteraceae bacterium]
MRPDTAHNPGDAIVAFAIAGHEPAQDVKAIAAGSSSGTNAVVAHQPTPPTDSTRPGAAL